MSYDALLTIWFVANHQLSEPNAIIGWVFAGIVATAAFLLMSSIEERKAVMIAGAGWAVGIGLLVVL
ncbi:hypothetical protein FTX61_20670 [Nitriliruptoraceae bacterium ZYF776]|nr:hypothetical protein [Profundirhabdus halotolerans]